MDKNILQESINVYGREQLCYFAEKNLKGTYYDCGILNVDDCSGKDVKCAFFQTTKQYTDSKDKAIDRCRKKGICDDCKYTSVQCLKSSELKSRGGK